MLQVLAITVPIYACVAIGHLTVRWGAMRRDDMGVLSRFVITFALPCMLFLAIGTRRLGDILMPTYLGAYAVGLLATFTVGYLYGRRRSGGAPAASAFDGLGMAAPNSGFVGYPVLVLALPSVAGLVLGLNMLVENLLIIPLAYLLAEGAAVGRSRVAVLGTYAKRLTRNPLLVGLGAGLVVSLLSVPLPEVLIRTADLFAKAGTALALFAVGGLQQTWPDVVTVQRVLVVSAGRLLLGPVLVFAALTGLVALGLPALSTTMTVALVLSAAMPVFTILPVLAQPYGQAEASSGVLLVTTAASFVTLSALLAVIS